jgi:hypothetical protein
MSEIRPLKRLPLSERLMFSIVCVECIVGDEKSDKGVSGKGFIFDFFFEI